MSATTRTIVSFALFAMALAIMPKIFSSGTALTMMSLMGVMIIFALSYNMLLGQTGLLSFGHAVYYGLAGFAAIHAMNAVVRNQLGVSLPFIPIVGGLAGLFFGILFGAISTRRAGTVFAMISLGLGELVVAVTLIMRGVFGGEEGISANRAKLEPFFGFKFGPQIEVYYLIAVWCFICVAAMYALTRTPFGRMCNAVRDNPERAEFVGYSTQRVRFIAFCLSALFAGVAGALGAISFELVNAQALSAQQSGMVLLMTYVGGAGHFFGPIIGAVLLTLLQMSLSDVTKAWMLYFGLLFIFVVMFWPGGIAGFIDQHRPIVRSGRIMRLAPSYLALAFPIAGIAAGTIGIIELAHHQLVEAASDGSGMKLFGVATDSATWTPWLAILALLVVSGLVYRFIWPKAAEAFATANAAAQGAQA